MGEIMIERVYDYRQDSERAGTVFLVDRLWPRGVGKEDLEGVTWAQDAAPSPNLRVWFGHTADRFAEFSSRYRGELDKHPERAEPLLEAARSGPVTLLYAAKDPEVNHALVLKGWLEDRLAA
ncbi:DUF488 family protein [Glycomyces sp. TRM65418]|uniref:DUF488 domain-containing protein n=1 Tax=Glycomyces sp. TRM65418 TaxID=2867006 RepID=UPI001D15E622|nr:DUF488 family protein [Glycomyces sp. TRM65418]MCC3764016.1 DUF488 family protein [Glycomyces sp. TRM65418]